MKGKELLEMLQGLSDENLELPVYVYADHGQEYYQQCYFSIENTTEYEYCLEDYYVHEDDLENWAEDNEESVGSLKQFIAIS